MSPDIFAVKRNKTRNKTNQRGAQPTMDRNETQQNKSKGGRNGDQNETKRAESPPDNLAFSPPSALANAGCDQAATHEIIICVRFVFYYAMLSPPQNTPTPSSSAMHPSPTPTATMVLTPLPQARSAKPYATICYHMPATPSRHYARVTVQHIHFGGGIYAITMYSRQCSAGYVL